MKTLYIVIPCYNEQEVLPETSKRLLEKVNSLVGQGKINPDSRIMMVDDGSKDKTWEIITKLHNENCVFEGVKLSRNRGHQNALVAGLYTAKEYADVTISMDADLQDDINAIDGMIDKYHEGCEIVYGVRSSRETDTFFKRFTAEGFYGITNKMGGELVFNHADYRLMSRRALEALFEYDEVNLFLRGIVPTIGFKTGIVEYERGERFAGESKYPLKKMLSFAGEGITSLTTKPLKLIMGVGIFTLFSAFVLLIVYLVRLGMGLGFVGWQICLTVMIFMSGLILTAIGIVAEYAGKIYLETKKRPRFFIDKHLHK